MGEHARVESIEALEKFRAALCKFVDDAGVGLNESEAEIQRTLFWVKQEQSAYWKTQTKKRAELVARAKSALTRKKMQKTALGSRFSYVDEQKALAAAERQYEEARQKTANVKRWSRALDEESFSYKRVAQALSQALELEIPNALVQLDNMIVALEAYTSSGALEEQTSTSADFGIDGELATEPVGSMARAEPSAAMPTAAAYQRLRRQTPSQGMRDDAPLAGSALAGSQWGAAIESVRDALLEVDVARTPVASSDKIVLARDCRKHERVYLERIESTAAHDSGWYVGPADDSEVAALDAVRIGDLLNDRPELAVAFEWPVGCLIVLRGAALEAVLDAQGAVLWPHGAPPP